MKNKQRGSSAERELIHAFWAKGWAAIRVAGSGSMRYPSPDIIASKDGKHIAIECKLTLERYKYFEKEEIKQLLEYAQKSGSEAHLAIKFGRDGWLFITPEQLSEKDASYGITYEKARQEGQTFEDLTNG